MRVRVLGDDVEERRPGEPKRPKHEIEVPRPEPRRKPLDIFFRALLEAAHGWATREQVDDLGLELVCVVGFQKALHERSPTRFVAAVEAARVPHSDQGDASRASGARQPCIGQDELEDGNRRRGDSQCHRENNHEQSSTSHQPRPRNVAGLHRLGRRPKVRLLADDLPREALKLLARPEAELVFEVAPCPLIDLEGLYMATRAIERDHELCDEVLPIRCLIDQPAQLSHERGMASKGKIRVDADLDRPQAKLVQSLGLRTALQVQRHIREYGAVPEAECLLCNGRGTRLVAGVQRLGCVVYEVLEDLRVENGPTEVDPVAAPPSLDGNPVRGESPAEPGHI
jgi:hypothetical protein